MKGEEGMRVQNDKFYVLKSKDEKCIYANEERAVTVLSGLLKENKNLNPEEISLLEVNVAREEWEIKQVPWSRITSARALNPEAYNSIRFITLNHSLNLTTSLDN